MPWKPWGETDFWLTQGLDALDEQLCHCGSGQFRDDCLNPDLSHRWQVEIETHYPRAAIEEFQKNDSYELQPGESLTARLLPEGETPVHPNELKQAEAAAEIEAMKRRHGLI